MILDIKTEILSKIDISLNQLVFLSLVLDNIKTNHQGITKIIALISDLEIQELIEYGFITKDDTPKGIVYKGTEALTKLLDKDNSFEIFSKAYPNYVTRPDGTKGFLKGNRKKCMEQFKHIIRKVDSSHLIDCLNYDIEQKTISGKLGYMKTMWKWLTQCEWEIIEDQMSANNNLNYSDYGTELL